MEDFFALNKAAAAAIRQVNPKAVIVGGAYNSTATDQWVTGLFGSGTLKDIDAVAYHPYSLNAEASAAVYQNFVNKALGRIRNNIWVTEVGYPTYTAKPRPPGRYGTDQLESAMPRVVTQTITLLAAAGAQRIFWYHLADPKIQDNSDSEDWFGLFKTEIDGSLVEKGGAYAYQFCAEHLPGKTWRGALPGAVFPGGIVSHYFAGPNRKRCLIMWNSSLFTDEIAVTLTLPGSNHRQHDVTDGSSTGISGSGTYTLYNTDHATENANVVCITWDE